VRRGEVTCEFAGKESSTGNADAPADTTVAMAAVAKLSVSANIGSAFTTHQHNDERLERLDLADLGREE
jgi:uncharacterized protein HemX